MSHGEIVCEVRCHLCGAKAVIEAQVLIGDRLKCHDCGRTTMISSVTEPFRENAKPVTYKPEHQAT